MWYCLKFDLLILDVNLPDGSGLELLRQAQKTGPVPVILLTANDMEMDIVSQEKAWYPVLRSCDPLGQGKRI